MGGCGVWSSDHSEESHRAPDGQGRVPSSTYSQEAAVQQGIGDISVWCLKTGREGSKTPGTHS